MKKGKVLKLVALVAALPFAYGCAGGAGALLAAAFGSAASVAGQGRAIRPSPQQLLFGYLFW